MKQPKNNPYKKTITITLDEETAHMIEQTMISFGLESRSVTAISLIRAGYGNIAGDAFLSSVLYAELKRMREHWSTGLAEHFEQQAQLLRSGH